MNVRIDSCTLLDMRDCLRVAKAAARRSLGCSRAVRPDKRAVSRIVAELLEDERGPERGRLVEEAVAGDRLAQRIVVALGKDKVANVGVRA